MMFSGLSAFPLTPMNNGNVDESAYIGLISRLVEAKVDSIGVLGSTGNYAYLTREERQLVAQLTMQRSSQIPVIVGISSLSTREILLLAEDAQKAGASAVLLSPMSYQPLTDNEVFKLYEAVNSQLSVPLCVYDNPGTTHFTFTDELHGRIAQLSNVKSIKIPGVSLDPQEAKNRVDNLRSLIPADVTIGVSGDASAAIGLNSGCDVWYSVIGGLYPKVAKAITTAAKKGGKQEALRLSEELNPLWDLFAQSGGSLRVIAAAAELQGFASSPCLPLPLNAIEGNKREKLLTLLNRLELS